MMVFILERVNFCQFISSDKKCATGATMLNNVKDFGADGNGITDDREEI